MLGSKQVNGWELAGGFPIFKGKTPGSAGGCGQGVSLESAPEASGPNAPAYAAPGARSSQGDMGQKGRSADVHAFRIPVRNDRTRMANDEQPLHHLVVGVAGRQRPQSAAC
jgi:hypothetical protein